MADAGLQRIVPRTHRDQGKSDAQDRLDLADRLALSPAEAARALGVSERHLRSFLSQIPHKYLGSRVVIPVDALRTWLATDSRAEAARVDAAVTEILEGIK